MTNNIRRNQGLNLVAAIESVDKSDLQALAQLARTTHDWVTERGLDASRWPLERFAEWFDNPGDDPSVYHGIDDAGQVQRFVMLHCRDHDAVFGVSSRRDKNAAGQRAENVATNVLLDILAPKGEEDAPYGRVWTLDADRLWRSRTGAAHLQEHCEDWDISITSPTLSFDPTIPGQFLLGAFSAETATQSADRLIRGGSNHRAAAHRQAVSKYPREKTHPAIAIDPQTRKMSYDPKVVAAIREIADRLLDGWTYDDLSHDISHRIPSHVLRGEPDYRGGNSRRSRHARNQQRELRGLPPLPLRFLEDGQTPNPQYRPETLADLFDPAGGLRALFKVTIPAKASATVTRRVDQDLEGIHPRDVQLEFMATGIYRRLIKDHRLSNRRRVRYCWLSVDLGIVDDRGYILDRDTVDRLKKLRDRRTRPNGGSQLPLSGLFNIAVDAPLYTKNGWLDPTKGRFVWRTSHNSGASAYRIYYEPLTAKPHGSDCQIVGYVHADELGAALRDAVIEALQESAAGITVTPPPVVSQRIQQLRRVERERDQARSAFEAAVDALAAEHLSPRARQRLTEVVQEREGDLDRLDATLHALRHQQESPAYRDVQAPLDTLVDILALIVPGTQLPAATARSCGKLLKALFRDPTMRLDAAHGAITFDLTLELPTQEGATLRVPIHGRLPNRAVDTWIAGLGGRFWHRRRPLQELWPETELKTPYELGHHWRNQVATGLLDLSQSSQRPLSGPGAANLLVRCPHAEVIDAALRILFGEDTGDLSDTCVEETRKLLFGSTDVQGSPLWNGPLCRPAVRAAQGTPKEA